MTTPQPGDAVLLAGASGLIGTRLAYQLGEAGYRVRRLVRRPPRTADEVRWDPAEGRLPAAAVDGVTCVIVLSGAGIGDKRWSEDYRKKLVSSRLQPVGLLARTLAEQSAAARLITASAVGYYGDRGDDVLTEDSGPGTGFLVDLCEQWEAAADPARESGIPVASVRTGIVLDPAGGALQRLMLPLKLGLAGPMGSGQQWWPWITLHDQVRAMIHLVTSSLTGPVNATAPEPERNRDVISALATILNRPSKLPLPGFALRAALGGFGGELLASQRVVPQALLTDGFEFSTPTIDDAARQLLG